MNKIILALLTLFSASYLIYGETNEIFEEGVITKSLLLKDVMREVEENSSLLKIANLQKEIVGVNIGRAKAPFDYYFFANGIIEDKKLPVPSILFGPADEGAKQKTLGSSIGLQKKFNSGLNLLASVSNSRLDTNNIFYTINPSLNSSIDFQISQPLLAGFGQNIQLSEQRIADNFFKAAEFNYLKNKKEIILNSINIYWNLFLLLKQIYAADASVKWVDKMLYNTEEMVKEGLLSQLELKQIKAERERQFYLKQSLIDAYIGLDSKLKSMMGANVQDLIKDEIYIPVDFPSIEIKFPTNLQEALNQAFNNREELRALEKQKVAGEIENNTARNMLLPQADLFFSFSYKGLGGDKIIKDDIFSDRILAIIPGGIGEAWNQIFNGKFPTVSAGITFQFPAKRYLASAKKIESDLKLDQLAEQINLTKLQITSEIKNLYHSYRAIDLQLKSAEAYLEYAKSALEGMKLKYNEGMANASEVLLATRDVIEAEYYYNKALVDKYMISCNLYLALGNDLNSLFKLILH